MHKNILLYKAMLQHFSGDARRCQHLIKVASLAKEIARLATLKRLALPRKSPF